MSLLAGCESDQHSTRDSGRNRRALKVLLTSVLLCEIVACLALVAWWLALIGYATAVTWIGYAVAANTAVTIAVTIAVVAFCWWYRRRFRFDLRMLFILMFLASLVSCGLAHFVAKCAREQRNDRATAIIAKHHARIWKQHENNDEDAPLEAYELDFGNSDLTDRDLADLVSHSEMMRADIWTGLDLSGSQVTDHGMAYLSQFPGLTNIDVSKTKVSASGIELLRDIPTLGSLTLDATQLRQLATIPDNELPHVSQVWLDDASIDDQAISDLHRWKNLDSVVIMQGALTDDGLASLGRFTALTHLHIDKCPGVTDAGLFQLKSLEHLQFLVVRDTNATTASGPKLQESLPNCRIIVGQRGGAFYEGGPVPTFHKKGDGG